MANQARSPVGGPEDTTGLRRPSTALEPNRPADSHPRGACDTTVANVCRSGL